MCIIRLLISIAIVIGMIICAILLMGALFIEYIPYIIAIGVTIFAIWYVYVTISK